jgi:hypothetical protein
VADAAEEGAPNREDAWMLLRLMEIYIAEPMADARNFMRTLPSGRTFAELREEYPPGTREFRHIDTVMVFWETIGSLLKRGLLNEELAFDTFLDAPPWPKMETAIHSLREERNNELEGENLEYAYRRSVDVLARRSKEKAPG